MFRLSLRSVQLTCTPVCRSPGRDDGSAGHQVALSIGRERQALTMDEIQPVVKHFPGDASMETMRANGTLFTSILKIAWLWWVSC